MADEERESNEEEVFEEGEIDLSEDGVDLGDEILDLGTDDDGVDFGLSANSLDD
ncbi:MAG: hypothetical protein ACYCZ7_00400 [Minisyncoccota bacterium]